jgi:uncharacterized membrane protein
MDSVKLEWRRQFSTSRQTRMAVLGSVTALSLSFALFLLWFAGAWIILPFAGLEILCVVAAFWWLERAVEDRDCVEVTETRVKVARHRGQRAQNFEFNRGWLSTEFKRDQMGGLHGVRLWQSGRCVELLEFLPVSEQHRALRDLRTALATRQFASRIN